MLAGETSYAKADPLPRLCFGVPGDGSGGLSRRAVGENRQRAGHRHRQGCTPFARSPAEWAKVGETKVVNAEMPGGPVTLELVDVPEKEALDILLRTAAWDTSPRHGRPTWQAPRSMTG